MWTSCNATTRHTTPITTYKPQTNFIRHSNHSLDDQSIVNGVRSSQAWEIGHELGLEVEYFAPLPKPYVRMYGAAANGGRRPLANVVELSASKYHYNVVVELPQVQLREDAARWTVNVTNEVTIDGQITLGAIFADKPMTGNKRNRVQLCPTEPWAISFFFPGPVDWWTASVHVPSNNIIEISVRKARPPAEPAATSSTAVVTGADCDPGLVGDTSRALYELMGMVDGWFV